VICQAAQIGFGQQAQSRKTPQDYYPRAAPAKFLVGKTPLFRHPDLVHPRCRYNAEQEEAISWLRITFELPPETDLKTLGALQNDLRLQRGREFWELGLYHEARLEFESLRKSVSQDPADSFRLANYMLDLGLYRPAIFGAPSFGIGRHGKSRRIAACANLLQPYPLRKIL